MPALARSWRYSENGTEMQTGKITYFNAEKGYGFIRPNVLGADQFFHVSGLIGTPGAALAPGQPVSFDVEFDSRRGKDRAIRVQTIWRAMSKIVKASVATDALIYADGGTVHSIPIIAWDCSSDPPAPITPIGAFYPGRAFAIQFDISFIIMPAREVVRSRADVDEYLTA
jgi:cold shock protein